MPSLQNLTLTGEKREEEDYHVIVVGAGHAGCEAALAASRLDCRTLLLTLNMENIALMPCNPAIGGPAKGHLVCEIDVLGGAMALISDKTFLQMRLLNSSKGAAVQAFRAQSDRYSYSRYMKLLLQEQENLHIKQDLVTELVWQEKGEKLELYGLITRLKCFYRAPTIVLCTGTSLNSRILIGENIYQEGRIGELAAPNLSRSLNKAGIKLQRFETDTPARLDNHSINFEKMQIQPGSSEPLYFSWVFRYREDLRADFNRVPPEVHPIYRSMLQEGWRTQIPCFSTFTNHRTHQIVKNNLHRGPKKSGVVEGTPPRYCPSLEDKVLVYPDKDRHILFVEPEGWQSAEVYLQGGYNSLPYDVQMDFLRTICGLEEVEIIRPAYAIEYDGLAPFQLHKTLENKRIAGLFTAGQVNGTSGYEEAAGQGLIAGINAALKVKGRKPFLLERSEAYLGVLIDDLTTKKITEPYRMHTSKAEHRLLLRQDNAYRRLAEKAYQNGLINSQRYDEFKKQKALFNQAREKFQSHSVLIKSSSNDHPHKKISWSDYLKRPENNLADLKKIAGEAWDKISYPDSILQDLAVEIKYEDYVKKEEQLVEKMRRLEDKKISLDLDYQQVAGLKNEAREKLSRIRPESLGQASRIPGVTPADLTVLMIYLEKMRREQ